MKRIFAFKKFAGISDAKGVSLYSAVACKLQSVGIAPDDGETEKRFCLRVITSDFLQALALKHDKGNEALTSATNEALIGKMMGFDALPIEVRAAHFLTAVNAPCPSGEALFSAASVALERRGFKRRAGELAKPFVDRVIRGQYFLRRQSSINRRDIDAARSRMGGMLKNTQPHLSDAIYLLAKRYCRAAGLDGGDCITQAVRHLTGAGFRREADEDDRTFISRVAPRGRLRDIRAFIATLEVEGKISAC